MFPVPLIVLKTGILYNVIACLSAAVSAGVFSALLSSRSKDPPALFSLSSSLALSSAAFLGLALANFLFWLGAPPSAVFFLDLSRLLILSSVYALFVFMSKSFGQKKGFFVAASFFFSAATTWLFLSLPGKCVQTYWGISLQRNASADIFAVIMLSLPVALLALSLAAQNIRRKTEALLFSSVFLFSLLLSLDLLSQNVSWASLIFRLLYIAVFFLMAAATETEQKEEFSAVSLKDALKGAKGKIRLPFFTKLLGIFILLSVVPIAVFGLLMFSTFKEIIDLYIYKPLLWNLKTSREEFLLALKNIQIQVLFLLGLTVTLVLLVSSAVSRSIAGELRRIGRGMKKISEGDLSVKILPTSNDEIGDLVKYFDVMAEEIKSAREKLENWNRELESEVSKRTKDLKDAMERLLELDKLKTQFISMVSHELRTPLTSINGFTSQFLEGRTGPMSEIQLKFLHIMKDSEARLLGLIDSLLDFANMETGKFKVERSPQMIDLIIRGAVDSVKDQLESKGIKIEVKTDAPNGKFMGDEARIKQVLLNLIDNAAKYSPENPSITISSKTEGGKIIVAIKDNGIGVKKDRINKIFERFYQADTSYTRKFGGLGLGLTISKEIIDAHGGRIWAESQGENKGSMFCFELPRVND
jgi:signal transduction histidine kinase